MAKKEITEERRKQLAENGRLGGLVKVPKGFAVMKDLDPELHKELSRKGGRNVKKQASKN